VTQGVRNKGETTDERKVRKQQFKELKREKRKMKTPKKVKKRRQVVAKKHNKKIK